MASQRDGGIAWCDETWNCIRGCSRVSEGCRNCYAETMAARFSDKGMPYHGLARRVLKMEGASQPRWTGEIKFVQEHLMDPLRWKRPRRIFVNSMSDLFHEKLTNEQIAAVFGVMAASPQHTFQVLTKRAKRMREWFEWMAEQVEVDGDPWTTLMRETTTFLAGHDRAWARYLDEHDHIEDACFEPWPLLNVWLGVSVENQEALAQRVPHLEECPAICRFLSCEPLLGPLDFSADALRHIHWVIAGCESGRGARPCDVEWLRAIRMQCQDAGVPFFLKQAVKDSSLASVGYGQPIMRDAVFAGEGSRVKSGGVIELPYLDGVQHAAFPEVSL